MNTWRRTALMTAILAATIPAAQAVDSVVLENTTYQTVNEPDKRVVNPTNNTAIVEDGRFVAFNVDLDTGSVLILNSDDAQITTTGNFHLGTGTIKRSETENLKNLTFTGGDMTIAGGSLTVDGTLTWNSLGGYTAGYLDVRDGGDLTVDTFVASSYYSLKSSANSTVTVRDLQSVGMVRNDGGIMNIQESAKVGHLWNLGTLNAENATIEIETREDMYPTDYDGKTKFEHADGNVYTFGNGIDREQRDDAKDAGVMKVGTLIVHGNAINSKDSKLNVNTMIVDGVLNNNDTGALINVTDGSVTAHTVSGEAGAFALTNSTLSTASASALGDVKAQNSVVEFRDGSSSINQFSGEGKTVRLTSTGADVSIEQKTGDITVNTTGTVNDSHSDVQATYDWLQDAVTLKNGEFEAGDRYVIDQGDVNDGMIVTFNADGSTSVQTTGNTTMSTYESLGSLGALQWRHEMNDLNKRMGDLRDNPGAVGSWARIYGSEQEYGSVTGKNVSVQVGADYQLGDWKVGAAFGYTDGSSDFDGGDADNDAYSIGVYGTWMADNGLFLDVIGKYGRLSNDFSINHIDGSFDNNAYSLSAEIGWRFEPCSFGFIEPQAELTYGRIDGDTFRAGNVRFEQGDFDSLVGRVGVRVGAKFPDDRGNLYLRVSGAYDFQGDYDNTVTSLVGAHRKLSEDLGGAWIETAIGGNFRLTDSTNAWVDLERSNGGEVVENWRWNIGLRTEF